MAFLTTNSEYAPASGQIVGILKTMHDEISKDLSDATNTENSAVTSYDELMAAKKKEVLSLSGMIEKKLTRVGNLGVEIQQMRNDAGGTAEGLVDDKKFLADLDKNCAKKSAEWEVIVKTRNEELLALADTIKVLNDDDALELFKKTLPGASASFMQVQVTMADQKRQALAILRARGKNSQLNFIALALQGKKVDFGKVLKMIDEMVVVLKAEQQDDDDKKEYCEAQFDTSDDKKKSLERSVANLEKAIAKGKEGIKALTEEIKALSDGIVALDKSVAEATEQRKEENEDFTELMANDAAAKELLGFAKNRLNKFYNPKLYKAPPKRALSEEDQLTVNMGGTLAPTAAPGGIAGTGIGLAQTGAAPPPPPEANLAYKKSGESSNGVIAMIDLLIADLDKDNQIMEVEEKDAQKEYEVFMADASEKRALDSKAITDKEAAKAETETQLEDNKDTKKSKMFEAMENAKYIGGLHEDCDWLLKYYETRKTARTGEIDALGKAKAVLSGADYSLVQVTAARLRGSQRAA